MTNVHHNDTVAFVRLAGAVERLHIVLQYHAKADVITRAIDAVQIAVGNYKRERPTSIWDSGINERNGPAPGVEPPGRGPRGMGQ
jgi:hypothetical protein